MAATGIAAGLTLVLVHRASVPQRQALLTAVLLVGTLAALVGWVGVVWRVEPLALVSSGRWRAAGTLTYENALAGLLVPLAIVAIAHVAAPGRDDDRSRAMASVVAAVCS